MVKKEVLQKMYDADARIEAARVESLERMALLQCERSAMAEGRIAATRSTVAEVGVKAQEVGAPPTHRGTPPLTPPGTPPASPPRSALLRPATPPGTPPLMPRPADGVAAPTTADPVTQANITAALAKLSKLRGGESAYDTAPVPSRVGVKCATSTVAVDERAAPFLAAVFDSPARRPRAALDGKTTGRRTRESLDHIDGAADVARSFFTSDALQRSVATAAMSAALAASEVHTAVRLFYLPLHFVESC